MLTDRATTKSLVGEKKLHFFKEWMFITDIEILLDGPYLNTIIYSIYSIYSMFFEQTWSELSKHGLN